jgi:glycosyltransferase involved in cell wall biosynthesis
MDQIGIIAIARNEGERLKRCLASVAKGGWPVVYVDSGSTDGSVALARSMGASVVELDLSIPFSAARARNEGFARLLKVDPAVAWVQFLDGDCELQPNWIPQALEEMAKNPSVGVVCGRRREQQPQQSIYNRLADLEWDRPAGEVASCGGDALFRVAAYAQSGGFNPSIVAGEEPELCRRLRQSGWTILRINAEMTLHDAATLRFGQWWKRQVRSGYGMMDVATRFKDDADPLFTNQIHSARLWTALSPLMPLQMLRLAIKIRPRLQNWKDAAAYGILTMMGKWGHVIGQWKYKRDRAAGRNTRLIEYKKV